MKKKNRKVLATAAPRITPQLELEQELKAIERAGKRISRSRESALAFLQKAGIADGRGRLAKRYRSK